MIRVIVALTLIACSAPIDPDPGLYPPYAEAGHYHRDAAPDVYMVPACLVEYPDDAGVVAFADDSCAPDASCVVNAEAGLVGYCGLAPL